jgi:hypothetical protein
MTLFAFDVEGDIEFCQDVLMLNHTFKTPVLSLQYNFSTLLMC